jgi:hypothetical protein
MNHTSKTARLLCGPLALALFATSCSLDKSIDKNTEQQLARHPVQESRMSDKALPGYVPTGVWRMKGRSGNVLYLAGTSHNVDQREIPFPSSYYAAYQESSDIFLEKDGESITFYWKMIRAFQDRIHTALEFTEDDMKNAHGRTDSESLSPATVKLLRQHYGSRYEKNKSSSPQGLIIEHQLFEDVEGEGVEDVFESLARRDRKQIMDLDKICTVNDFRPMLDAVDEDARKLIAKKGPDAAVREVILEKDKEMKNWRYGLTDRTSKKRAVGLNAHPSLNQMLIPGRNQHWMKDITRALEGKRTTAVYVDALHLPGPDGLLELLRKQGYKPEQMYGIDHPRLTNATANR